MAPLKEVSFSHCPEECLRLALQADSAKNRALWAQRGLEAIDPEDLAPDTQVLLLRQLYLAFLESRRYLQAAEVAVEMASVGPLEDVAHHDASRAFSAAGELERAVEQQRMAARAAPPGRRSFHHWALGTLLHFGGDAVGAAAAMQRGERWAHADRPLLRAHRAWIRLESGQPVRQLGVIVSDLERSKAREGYGQLVLGMLYRCMGDTRRAAVHLRAFLRRNAAADAGKAAGLREELRRARSTLAEIESD
jgi:hypothetical protein